MSYVKRFFGHLGTVLKHKYWVFYYASCLGYPWRGIMHDMSKLSPTEFLESVRYWSGKRSPINTAKETVGISYAWLHHKGRNPHHYEYWVDVVGGKEVYHKIPFKYVVEMVCDWLSACRTYEGNAENVFGQEYEWWCSKSKHIKINADTKRLIHRLLWNLAEHQEYRNGDEKAALRDVSLIIPACKRMYENGFVDDKDETY